MKQAEWIWYPDDFEIELSGKFMAERYERDIPIPPFWRLDSCYKNVKFKKIYELSAAHDDRIGDHRCNDHRDQDKEYDTDALKLSSGIFRIKLLAPDRDRLQKKHIAQPQDENSQKQNRIP